ncbi:MAG TPA: aldolase [Jatrophihabitans sp.]|nr:aldolase [Jatrophihabitans sp.]
MIDPTFLDEMLDGDDAERTRRYPGPPLGRQPVHTVYVPADRFNAHVVTEWGLAAVQLLDEHGPLPDTDADIDARVHAKLRAEPIEDLRIDFEDGYGVREDEEEDAAARAVASALAQEGAPAFVGIRIKSLEADTRHRAVRTLAIFLEEFGPRPDGFRVTLPKVSSVPQVEAMVALCAAVEDDQPLRFELQIEMPQAVLGADGTALVAQMIHAADGRCAGLHYGTYDYTAALGIAAAQQSLEHPAADHAKAVMQVAAAGTGVPVCDGSTNVLPVGSSDAIRAAWQLHARLVRRSLERGFYQGWDLHPAQLPTRYAATFAFYRDGVSVAAARLGAYLEQAAGGVLDEPATARALAGFLLRALHCGALSPDSPELSALRHVLTHQGADKSREPPELSALRHALTH